jgi:hypothetical protein
MTDERRIVDAWMQHPTPRLAPDVRVVATLVARRSATITLDATIAAMMPAACESG